MTRKPDHYFWLYRHKYEDVESFFAHVTDLLQTTNIRLNVLLVYSSFDLFTEFHSDDHEPYEVSIINSNPVFTLQLTRLQDSKTNPSYVIVLKFQPDLPVYLLISDCKTREFKSVIQPFLKKYHPTISNIFLTNTEILLILDRITEKYGVTIKVIKSVCKKRLFHMEKPEAQVTYTNMNIDDLVNQISSNEQWIHSLQYVASPAEKKTLGKFFFKGFLSRLGFFSIRHDFRPLIETIIPNAIRYASVRNKYLELREAKANERFPEPIVVQFEKEVFKETGYLEYFTQSLLGLESCSISQYHTNPYFHVSLIDYSDSSSYDIWVVSATVIVIFPRFSATVASMNRIVNLIFERISEGEIKDFESVQANIR